MKAETRSRADKPSPRDTVAPRTCLWLKNEAGRKGVPVLRSFERWLAAIPDLRKRRGWTEVNVLIVGSTAGRRYNREFRGRDYATNVLSFPFEPMPGEHSGLLGDLVICAPVVAREAREQRKQARDHFAHMLLIDLGLGPYADQRIDYWQESFVPSTLRDVVAGANVADGTAASPLAAAPVELAHAPPAPATRHW